MSISPLVRLLVLFLSLFVCQAVNAQPYEKPSNLVVRDVIDPSFLKSEHYSIDPKVTSNGYFNTYLMHSPYGDLTVEGNALLLMRIREYPAIAELKKITQSDAFLEAAKKGGKELLLAPITAGEKFYEIISDREKTVETIKKVPSGIVSIFSWAGRQVESGYDAVNEYFQEEPETSSDKNNKPNGQSNGKDKDITAQGQKQAKKYALDYVKYNKNEKELFKMMNVSPYTSNQIIKNEIEKIARIQTGVGFAFRFVPGLGTLGLISNVNSVHDRAEQIAHFQDPDLIESEAKKLLTQMNVSEEVRKEFLDADGYAPPLLLSLLQSLNRLKKAQGRDVFLKLASNAEREPTAYFFERMAARFAAIDATRPIERIVFAPKFPMIRFSSKSFLICLPIDYLFWTKEAAEVIKKVKASVRPGNGTIAVEIAGKASPLALKQFAAEGIAVTTNVPM